MTVLPIKQSIMEHSIKGSDVSCLEEPKKLDIVLQKVVIKEGHREKLAEVYCQVIYLNSPDINKLRSRRIQLPEQLPVQ